MRCHRGVYSALRGQVWARTTWSPYLLDDTERVAPYPSKRKPRRLVAAWQEWQGSTFVRLRVAVRSPGRFRRTVRSQRTSANRGERCAESTSWGSLVRAQSGGNRMATLVGGAPVSAARLDAVLGNVRPGRRRPYHSVA